MISRMVVAGTMLVFAGEAAAQHSGTGNTLPSTPERDIKPAEPTPEPAAEPARHSAAGAAKSDIDLLKAPATPEPVRHGTAPPAIELLKQPAGTVPAAEPETVPASAEDMVPANAVNPTPDAAAPAAPALTEAATPAAAAPPAMTQAVAPAPGAAAVAAPQPQPALPAPEPAAAASPEPAAAVAETPATSPTPPPQTVPTAVQPDRDLAPYGPPATGWQVWSRVRAGKTACFAVKPAIDQAAPTPAAGRLFDGPKPYVIVSVTAPGAQPAWRIIHDGLPTLDDRIFVVGGSDWVEPSSFTSVLELDGRAIDVYGKGETLRDGMRVPFETTGKIEMTGLGAAVGTLTRCAAGAEAPSGAASQGGTGEARVADAVEAPGTPPGADGGN